jgi:hypothetical protein
VYHSTRFSSGGDEDVFVDGGDGSIEREFGRSIVAFGGGGEDFEDEGGVFDHVLVGVGVLEAAAGDHDVGVEIGAVGADVEAKAAKRAEWGAVPPDMA